QRHLRSSPVVERTDTKGVGVVAAQAANSSSSDDRPVRKQSGTNAGPCDDGILDSRLLPRPSESETRGANAPPATVHVKGQILLRHGFRYETQGTTANRSGRHDARRRGW